MLKRRNEEDEVIVETGHDKVKVIVNEINILFFKHVAREIGGVFNSLGAY